MKRPRGTHPIYWRTNAHKPPNDWAITCIDEEVDITKGRLPKTLFERPTESSIPYLLIDGIVNGGALYTEDKGLPLVEEGDTVVVADGSRSGLALRGNSGALGSTLLSYRAQDGFDGDFLFYLLESLYPYANTAPIGGAIPHLDKRLIGQMPLTLPPNPERQAIGRALKSLDIYSAALEKELAAARRLKTALMQQLFTKGIPGRHSAFAEIKHGMRPASWGVVSLAHLADVDAGVTLNQDRAARTNAYRYLTVVNAQRDHIDLTENRTLELWDSEVPAKLLQEKDILVVEGHANGSEIGRASMVDEKTSGMTFQNHLFRVRISTGDVLPEFLLYTLNSERIRRHLNAVCNTSSGLNTINRRMLRRVEIPVPRPDEQQEVVDLINASKQTIAACDAKMEALLFLKRSLLQNLLTGKIRVTMEVKT